MWPLWVMITMMEMMKLWRRGDSLWNFFYKNMSLWRTKNTGLVKNQVALFLTSKKENQVARMGGWGGQVIRAMLKRKHFFSADVFPYSWSHRWSPKAVHWPSHLRGEVWGTSALPSLQSPPPSPPRPLLLLVHLSPDLPLGHSHQLLLSCPA